VSTSRSSRRTCGCPGSGALSKSQIGASDFRLGETPLLHDPVGPPAIILPTCPSQPTADGWGRSTILGSREHYRRNTLQDDALKLNSGHYRIGQPGKVRKRLRPPPSRVLSRRKTPGPSGAQPWTGPTVTGGCTSDGGAISWIGIRRVAKITSVPIAIMASLSTISLDFSSSWVWFCGLQIQGREWPQKCHLVDTATADFCSRCARQSCPELPASRRRLTYCGYQVLMNIATTSRLYEMASYAQPGRVG